jgi:alpha-galactosidase
MQRRAHATPGPSRWRLRAGMVAVGAALVLPAAPLFSLVAAPPAMALGNGLALTPPMGFNDWNAYGCGVSESLIESTAAKMVSSGMAADGYKYVNIDDCWLQKTRAANGSLQPDFTKFPDGISGTASYVHSLGLKLGIYEDAGTATCAGYPGSLGHEQQDASTLASWGVDYLKYDNCNNNSIPAQTRYTAMGNALAATGRPIVYSLSSWGQESVWTWGASVANLWRTTGDIQPNFASMLSIFHANVGLAAFAGPGHWNDPDMLEIGNGMSATEDQSEFSLWSEMAAPLIAGTNLVNASSTTLSILTNKAVIAVDQDSLGKQGTEVSSSGGLDVLAKPLANGDVSVALFNENSSAATITTSASAIGKTGSSSYALTNVWTGATSATSGTISASVPAHGTVLYRVSGGSSSGGGGGGGGSAGEVHAVGAGKCLEVPGASQANGTQVDIWDCNAGSNQEWTYTSGKALTVYSGTKCLDAYNNQTTPGTKVEIWACNGGANQQWNVNSGGTITGAQSGLCLDVTGASTANGALGELWTCNGASNQQWTGA